MKCLRFLTIWLLTIMAGVSLTPHGYSQTWTGGAATDAWNAGANWGGTAPGVNGAAVFNDPAPPAFRAIDLSGNQSAGTVTFSGSDALGNYSLGRQAAPGSDFGGTLTLSGAAALTNSSNKVVTITDNPNFGQNPTLSLTNSAPVIANSGTGSIIFNGGVSAGSNPLVVNNNNSSPTGLISFNSTLTAAAIEVNGVGGVNLPTGLTTAVRGTGRVENTLSIAGGGNYSPGALNAIGTQTLNGGLTLSATNSTLTIDLGASGTNDVIAFTNDLLNLPVNPTVALRFTTTPTIGSTWNVFTGVTGIGTTGSYDLTNLAVDSISGSVGSFARTDFVWSRSGTTLSITAVPEPSSMALLGLASASFGGWSFRKRWMKKKTAK